MIDWDRADWGGHITESATGSHLDAEGDQTGE